MSIFFGGPGLLSTHASGRIVRRHAGMALREIRELPMAVISAGFSSHSWF